MANQLNLDTTPTVVAVVCRCKRTLCNGIVVVATAAFVDGFVFYSFPCSSPSSSSSSFHSSFKHVLCCLLAYFFVLLASVDANTMEKMYEPHIIEYNTIRYDIRMYVYYVCNISIYSKVIFIRLLWSVCVAYYVCVCVCEYVQYTHSLCVVRARKVFGMVYIFYRMDAFLWHCTKFQR